MLCILTINRSKEARSVKEAICKFINTNQANVLYSPDDLMCVFVHALNQKYFFLLIEILK